MVKDFIASFERDIVQLDAIEYWSGLALVCIVCAIAFYRMYRWYHHARIIENMPTARVRSAAQGYVELKGEARLMKGPVIVSPLSGRHCVWYRYKIEEKVQKYQANGKSSSYWRVVKQQTSDELFLLEDETGRCVIDPDDADVITTDKRTWYKNDIVPPRRYTEELITENEPLYALGLFKTVANVERHKLREHVSHLLRKWKNDPAQLLHDYDMNKDGQLSPDEWERVRLAAERQVQRDHGQQEKMEQLHILKNSEHADQAFILSSISEEKLISRYKWRAIGYSAVFFITGSLVVWAINTRLGM